MKDSLLFVLKTLIPCMLLVSVVYYLGAGALIGAFMKNPSIIAYGTQFLRGFCLGLPFLCMDFVAVGVFQAIGLGSAAFIFAILRKIVLEIPALYVLNYFFPLYGLSYSQFAAEFVLSIVAVWMLARIFRKLQSQPKTV